VTAYSWLMAPQEKTGISTEGLAEALGDGVNALALVGALISTLKDKGVLTDADIAQVESVAASLAETELKAVDEAGD
jgi:hypothetical protein